jgi:hypothetical protein
MAPRIHIRSALSLAILSGGASAPTLKKRKLTAPPNLSAETFGKGIKPPMNADKLRCLSSGSDRRIE